MIDPLKLHAYADGEATHDEIAEIEARLSGCAASQAELEAIRSFKQGLGAHRLEIEYREVWTVCRGRLTEMDRARKTERFVGKYAWALATGIVGLVVLTGVARRGMASPSIGSADLAQIMSQIGPGKRSSTINPREAQIADAMLRRTRLAIENNGLQAVAVSEAVCDGMLVRRITLRDGAGQMALLDLPSEARFEGLEPVSGTTMQAGQIDDLNCVVWTSGERKLVLVGEREPGELARVAEQIHESR